MRIEPAKCAVLIPSAGAIDLGCEAALRELERRGYVVRRASGSVSIDQVRSQLASNALADGFEALMWIDSDVRFDPSSVDLLRAHDKDIVCGIYPKKGPRALASNLDPATDEVVFGKGGGLVRIAYAATGFLYTRRKVYEDVREKHALPLCNQRDKRPFYPFFLPMVVPDGDGHWYMGEDFAFCERARRAGHEVWADTSIRLWHVGSYAYGWEDAGSEMKRFASYRFQVERPKGT
jgi:hypothetical protein